MEKAEGTLQTRSVASCSSRRPNASSAGAAAARARAKAEAAKARSSFAKKEMALKVEKAQLEATTSMLSLEQEAAVDGRAAPNLTLSCLRFLLIPENVPKNVSLNRPKRKEEYRLHQNDNSSIEMNHNPVITTHNQAEHNQVTVDSFSATPNQREEAQQLRPSPDTHHNASHMQNGSRFCEPNQNSPLSSSPSHKPHHAHQNQANVTDCQVLGWTGTRHDRLDPAQRPTVQLQGVERVLQKYSERFRFDAQ